MQIRENNLKKNLQGNNRIEGDNKKNRNKTQYKNLRECKKSN